MSPSSRAVRNRCSSSVARASSSRTASRRAVCEPAPLSAPTRVNVSSTSATVSDGSAAGAGASRSAAQPTPICRWVSTPDSQATAAGVSAGSSRRSRSASTRDLAAARRGVADGGRRLDELAQQHPPIVPASAAVPRLSPGPFVPPPDATELIVVRHGSSADAVPGEPFELIEGQSNPPLSPDGEAQARAVAERLAREPVAGALHQHARPHRADRGAAGGAHRARAGRRCPTCARCTSASSRAAASGSPSPNRDPVIARLLAEQRWEVIPGAESSAALAARVRARGRAGGGGGRAGRRRGGGHATAA